MNSYEVDQEIMYLGGWSESKWIRGRIHSSVATYGRRPQISYYRIVPWNARGVTIVEVACDGSRITIAPPTEIRPVSPLILLAECAGDVDVGGIEF